MQQPPLGLFATDSLIGEEDRAIRDTGPRVRLSVGKPNNVREAITVARKCRTILGAGGITLEHAVMRHADNSESVLTYEGTSEVHQLVVGQALTGESAFR